jgi:GTP-binding protein
MGSIDKGETDNMAEPTSENLAPADTCLPRVAIIGRQNVGKSTLLNRVAGRHVALVEDLPGTTRDRLTAEVTWAETPFTLVDTGGFESVSETTLSQQVAQQAELAISQSDVIVFMVDAKDGVTPLDQEIAAKLRRADKPVLLVANKADSERLETSALEFYELGWGDPVLISAFHGRGVAELLDQLVALLPPILPVRTMPEFMKIALVGRPNVGKSLLLNALLGEERVIVDEVAGTTRDAIDILFDFKGQGVLLIDTAGIRRRGKVEVGVEKHSVARSLKAMERADVVLLVVDATELLAAQDLHVLGFVQQSLKGMVLIVNKWDLIENKDMAAYTKYISSRLKATPYVPVLFTSAKMHQGIEHILPQAAAVYQERLKRLPTAEVNHVVQQAVAAHNMPHTGGRRLKIFYATQAGTNPPTFVFFTSDPTLIHFSYRRYLENKLRQAFGFMGTPIQLVFKARGGA